MLRDHNTLSILLGQLRSPSLTVVSNACGTLWNLSARCAEDQRTLWELGAVPMLRSLINSKHKMISMGSSAELKNLLQAKPEGMSLTDSRHGLGLPSLQARKQKALEQELDPSLSETCDNIETSPRSSPTNNIGNEPPFFGHGASDGGQFFPGTNRPMFHSIGTPYSNVLRSESRDSIASTHSDNSHDRMRQLLMKHHKANHNGETDSNGLPIDLSLRSMAPPSNTHPDIAQMSQEEIQRHLAANGSADEIFANQMRRAKELSRQDSDSPPSFDSPTHEISRSKDSIQSKKSAELKESEQNGSSDCMFNGHFPFDEEHYNLYNEFVNQGLGIDDIDILEEPINFGLKFSGNQQSKSSANDSIGNLSSRSSERPSPKINNYMNENRGTKSPASDTNNSEEAPGSNKSFQDPSYTETDLDNIDQPTDFSLR